MFDHNMGKQLAKTKKPIISIIMPVYGVEKWIEKSFKSALFQDYDPLEIVVVDDASPDKSIEIVRNILSREIIKKNVKIITHEKNKGLAKSRETGIQNATGEYVFHLDSDDWIETNCISLLASHIDESRSVDMISANCRNIFSNGVVNRQLKETQNPQQTVLGMMRKEIEWNVWNRLIKKTLYTDLYFPEINNGEDYISTIQLLYKAKNVTVLPNITYNYNRLNENSFQHKKADIKNINDREKAVLYLQDIYKGNSDVKDALNIGLLKTKITNILLVHEKEDLKKIKIPKSLFKLKYISKLNLKYIPILLLFKLKCNNLILLLRR